MKVTLHRKDGSTKRVEVDASVQVEMFIVEGDGPLWIGSLNHPVMNPNRWREDRYKLTKRDGGLAYVADCPQTDNRVAS